MLLSGLIVKKFKQPEGYAPGIYFGMSNEDYHNDHALSHSGITNILVSEYDYWEKSSLNPNRNRRQPSQDYQPAMFFGILAETFLLEEKRFFERYKVIGQTKSYQNDGRPLLSSTLFDDVKQSAAMLRKDPDTAAYFTHGYPQVTIIYIHPTTGMRMRIRPDWLRTFGCIDLKRLRSITNSKLGWDCVEYGYDLQEQMYREGMMIAKEGLRAGTMKAFGDYDPAWLKAFADDPDTMFRFVFQRSTKPFIYCVKYFDDEIRKNAKALVEEGIHKYRRAVEQYGANEWPCGSAKAEEFSIYHFPRRTFDR